MGPAACGGVTDLGSGEAWLGEMVDVVDWREAGPGARPVAQWEEAAAQGEGVEAEVCGVVVEMGGQTGAELVVSLTAPPAVSACRWPRAARWRTMMACQA